MLDSINDAEQAIEENFGNTIKLCVGEIFVESDEDQAKAFIGKLKKKYNTKQNETRAAFDSTKKRLDELKVILYSKFGQRLRLDED